MNRTLLFAITAVTIMTAAGAASAQRIILDFGPNYDPPPPGYGRGYGPPPAVYGPGYGPPPPGYGPGYGPPGPYYRSYGGGGGGYYRPGRFRTWNGCQTGWTVQDGLCKPYRGY
jgi:hypothetical protein